MTTQETKYFKVGTDVYSGTNPADIQHIDLPTFKSLGLNIDLLGQGVTQGKTLSQMGIGTVPNAGGTPNFQGGSVDANSLTNTIIPQVPSQQPSNGTVADYQGLLANAMSILPNPEVAAAEKSYKDTQQAIIDLTKQYEGQTAFTQQAEAQYGVPEKQQMVNNLTQQLSALNAEAVASTISAQGRPTEGTYLTSALNQEMSMIERQRAIKSLLISSQLTAAQGNLSLAESQVEKATNLKYQPIQAQLETYKAILTANYENLNRVEKRVADQLKQQTDIKLAMIQQNIDNEKQVKTNLLSQASQYPDAKIDLNTDTLESANNKITQNSKIYQNQVRLLGTSAGGGIGELSSASQAVMANPVIYNTLSAAERNRVAGELQASGYDMTLLAGSATASQKSKDAISAFNSADNLLNTIEGLTSKVITATSTMGRTTQAAKLALPNVLLGKDAVLFKDTVKAFTSQLARAAGEKGVLTDMDVARIRAALPSSSDTVDIANAKIATLKGLFAGIKAGAMKAYGPTTNQGTYEDYLNAIK